MSLEALLTEVRIHEGVSPATINTFVGDLALFEATRPDPSRPVARFDGTTVSQHELPDLWQQPYSIEQAAELLDATFSGEEITSLAELEYLVGGLGASTQLSRLIKDVVNNPDRLSQAAESSEKHPLGFYKIPLLTSGNYQLRINIRPAVRAARPWFRTKDLLGTQFGGQQDVHDHRARFASKNLLRGRLVTTVYGFTDEEPPQHATLPSALEANDQHAIEWLYRQLWRVSNGLHEEHEPTSVWVYGADQSDRNSEAMILKGMGYIKLLLNAIINPNGIYSVSESTYHRDRPRSHTEPTATLFLRGQTQDKTDTIARTSPMTGNDRVDKPKQRLTQREARKGLVSLADKLL